MSIISSHNLLSYFARQVAELVAVCIGLEKNEKILDHYYTFCESAIQKGVACEFIEVREIFRMLLNVIKKTREEPPAYAVCPKKLEDLLEICALRREASVWEKRHSKETQCKLETGTHC
jgi:hypothetical protein